MAATFNYARAWRELAQPCYVISVRPDAKALYREVAKRSGSLVQGRNLDVPIPDDLLELFRAIPDPGLAIASRVIHFWGHWAHPGDNWMLVAKKLPPPTRHWPHTTLMTFQASYYGGRDKAKAAALAWQETCWVPDNWELVCSRNGPSRDCGATWKFSNMADQVLAERIGFASRREAHGFSIQEGWLHRWDRDGYKICLGWATQEVHVRATSLHAQGKSWSAVRDEITSGDLLFQWWHEAGDKFMDHTPGTKYDDSELPKLFQPVVDDHFNVLTVRHVNHKPHPFVITQEHVAKSHGILDPTVARCGHPDCRSAYGRHTGAYEEHTSERAVFLQCKHDVAQSEAQECLAQLKPLLEEHKVDGVAFAEHPDGWKIVDDLE